MLKQKLIKKISPYLIVATGLFFAGFVSFLLVSYAGSYKVESSENKVKGITSTINVVAPSPQPSTSIVTKPIIKIVSHVTPSPTSNILIPTPTPFSTPSTNSQNNSSVTTSTPTPAPTQNIQITQVNLTINGSSGFTVLINDGGNQCDVLSKALADGKISSLNMRYDSNYGTYAVYQINGIGKENSVWWTYTVNGQSPNQGCSYVKIKNNDNIEWKYIGS